MMTVEHFSRKRKLEDLLDSSDDSGCIEGRIFMVWPPRQGMHRINLEVTQDAGLYRFEVQVPYRDGVAFRPHDRVRIALRGVKVDQRQQSSAPHAFPAVLRFPDGIAFRYLNGVNEGKVVDTWGDTDTDEWYNPPGETVQFACAQDPPPSPTDNTAQSTRPDDEIRGRSFKARRKRRKKERESTVQVVTNKPPPADVPRRERQTTVSVSEARIQSHQAVGETSVSEAKEIDHDVPEPTDLPVPRVEAGMRTERGDVFTALSHLEKGHSLINVIAVVTHATSGNKTRTNEWSRSLTLVDPSVIDSSLRCVKVNCFQKKYFEWLPQAQADDIIILRKLKVVEFNDAVSMIGYGDKLRWAVYDPVNDSIRPPSKGDAPGNEQVDDGMGYEYSPYWEPFEDGAEVEYCRKLGEWWKTLKASGGGATVVHCASSEPKQHLLVSEASPDRPPRGFFNCTVEVLQKFDNGGEAMIVYVTDYTTNPRVNAVQATWCPPQLSEFVLQCSMWDAARNVARMMNPGEYWYLHNVRAKWNPNACMEATVQLADKLTQRQEREANAHPHFKALLARKEAFKLGNPGATSTTSHVFPEMLFQDVEESTSFLTCTVELLHIDSGSRDGRFAYVTDYTYNPDLPTTVATADWAHNLDHRIVKITLDDAQAQAAAKLEPGSICKVQNLRVKRPGVGSIHGCLGGTDPLIVTLSDLSSEPVRTLQRNKDRWKRENVLNGSSPPLNGPSLHGAGSDVPKPDMSAVSSSGVATVQQVLAWPTPATFQVLVRAVDFYPFALEDACALRCMKCNTSPPPSFRQCPQCDDMVETHCEWCFRVYVMLRDERGDEIIASLSSKECRLMEGLEPADFRRDQKAFRAFLDRVDPVFGNLRDVHLSWSKNEYKEIESPRLKVTLESWDVGEGMAYGVLDIERVSLVH